MDKSCDMQIGDQFSCENCAFEMEVIVPCDVCDEGRIMCPCCGENMHPKE